MGRVFLQQGGWSWRFKNPHCTAQHKSNMECYYFPLSKCTMEDALGTIRTINPEYPQPLPIVERGLNMSGLNHHRRLSQSSGFKVHARSGPGNGTASKPQPNSHHHKPHHTSGHSGGQGAGQGAGQSAAPGAVWTGKQDADLEAAVIRHGVQGQWQKIAADMQMHGKTDTECLFRLRSVLRKKLNNRKGPGPKGARNFNDDGSMMDILLEGYGVVTLNRAFESTLTDNKVALKLRHKTKFCDNVIVLAKDVLLEHRKHVPEVFSPIIDCLSVYQKKSQHFWWRTISVSFFLRPNEATLALLDQHADPVVKAANGNCVSAYVRHGDKAIEMALIPFQAYGDAADALWKGSLSGRGSSKDDKVFYLGSEDPDVFKQAGEWATKNKINLRFSNVSQVLLSDRMGIMTHKTMELSIPVNRQMEYFSYLLHLSDLVRCRAMVCTLASNYCRLVDEMRATVGGKANTYFADLSPETCQKPPCLRPFTIANYQGPIIDPSEKLWR